MFSFLAQRHRKKQASQAWSHVSQISSSLPDFIDNTCWKREAEGRGKRLEKFQNVR
jgi:hypothetical protein